MKVLAPVAIVIVALLMSTPAWADPPTVEPTQDQLDTNQKGIAAFVDGDGKTAVRYFQASLALGELNVTYLNLGRVLQKQGKCSDAFAAFEKTKIAPRVSSPTPDQVQGLLDRYMGELAKECPAVVVIECPEADVQVELGGEPIACGTTREMRWGTYNFVVRRAGEATTKNIELKPGMQVTLTAEAVQEKAVSTGTDSFDTQNPEEMLQAGAVEPAESNMGPIIMISSGAALIIGSFLMDGAVLDWPDTARNGEFDGMDFVPAAGYAAGTTLIVFGVLQWN